MKYSALFEISVAHPYYEDGRCTDISVVVSVASEALLRRHRAIVKGRPHGVVVIVPITDAGLPVIPFSDDATLTFEMRKPGEDFYRFTDAAAIEAMAAPVFTNAAGQTPLSSGALALVERGPGTSARDQLGVLAKIEIAGLSALVPAASPSRFHVELSPKSTRWVYYVVTDVPAGAGTGVFTIVDTDSSPVVFGASNTRDLVSLPDDSDPVARLLALRYPGLRRFRFISDAPLVASAEPRKYLELRADGSMVQEHLPNPLIRALSRIGVGSPAVEEDIVYGVIQHITQGTTMPAV